MRVAYLINQYPMVSTTFIRREILALERLGSQVQRIALRGWDAIVMDAADATEQERTQYVLQNGALPLVASLLKVMLTAPLPFLATLALALRIGWRADRPLLYHFVYLAEACRVLSWVKSSGAIHIHSHFGTNAAEVAMLVRALGGPAYSFTVHGPIEFDKPEFVQLAEKVRRSAFTVAITSFARSQIYRWVEQPCWNKVKLIHCGIEMAFHDVGPVDPQPTPRLVCLGRLSAEKGQLLLVEAVSRLAAKGVWFNLTLVGDGPMRRTIEAIVAERGLSDRIHLTGSIPTERLREELLAARALVVPSFSEGLPMVMMEAMALRRPVLATWIAGIPELVRPGIEGWLFRPGSVDALVGAIEDCLSKSAEQLRVMGEAARTRVLERHSVDVQARMLAQLFEHATTPAISPR
jgi:colanic acid/amylovoran biosynthesis glycosyltransferase